MSTGDMLNNMRCLQSCLKAININPLTDKDKKDLQKGDPNIFIYILRFTLLEFSHPVAQLIASQQIQLSMTNDIRFIDGVYKVLRDIFNYKPKISKDMFLSTGFAERKIIMMQDIIRMVQKKNQGLAPKKKLKGRKPTGVSLPKAPSPPGACGVVTPIMSEHDSSEASPTQSGASAAAVRPKSSQPLATDSRPPLPTGTGNDDANPPSVPVFDSHQYTAPSPVVDPVMIIELDDERNNARLVTRHIPYSINTETPSMSHDEGYKSAEISPTSEFVEITHLKDKLNACMKAIGKLDSRLSDLVNRVERLESLRDVGNRLEQKLESAAMERKTLLDRLVLMENQVVILNTLSNFSGQMKPSTEGSSSGPTHTNSVTSQGKRAQTGSEIPPHQRHTSILSPLSLTSVSSATSEFSSPEPVFGSPYSDSSPLHCKPAIKVNGNAEKMDICLQNQIERVNDIMKVTKSMLQSKPPSYTQED